MSLTLCLPMFNFLRDYQHRIVDYIDERDYTLLYGGTGLGKTLAALTACIQGASGLRVVVTPKPALGVWQEDWQKFNLDALTAVKLVTLRSGSSKDKQKRVDKVADDNAIIVVNYATARLMVWEHLPVSMVVADECHRLGTHNSKTSITLAKQFAHVPKHLAMSGTPFDDGLEKLYGIIRFLDPVVFDHGAKHPQAKMFGHYNDFLGSYCNTYMINHNIPVINSKNPYKNVDELMARIAPFTLRIETSDVIDLPDVVNQIYRVPMRGKWKKAYHQLKTDAALEIDDIIFTEPHILSRIIKLQQLSTSGVLENADGKVEFDISDRVNQLAYLLETISEPVVVFTRFKRDVQLIADALDEPVSLLTGETDNHEQWKHGANRVLVANITAGSEGVRLERARHIIFWSTGWSLKAYTQALGRVWRDGQISETVFFHHILTENTIDETIYDALSSKTHIRDQAKARL